MSNHPYKQRTIGIKDKDHDGDDHQNEIRVVKKPKPNNGHNVITGWSLGSSLDCPLLYDKRNVCC
jgi:hypothetical protein